ncbi:MAG: VacJ family lipoprotein [Desulfobacterales bacterium]
MRYISIMLIVVAVYITGCAHDRAMTATDVSPTLSSSQNSKKYPEKDKPSDEKNKTQNLSDKDLNELYAEAEAGVVHVADPIEPWNRAMYHFNDKFYFWLLKPAAKGYRYIVPTPLRTSVKNFFYNLIAPIRLVNCLLQGKFNSAGTEFTRFVLNSTAGMLGFLDPAQNYPLLKPKEEDLGLTFANYGIGNGFYIVWPILGPSTIRDSVGTAGDLFLNPIAYVRPTEAAFGIGAYDKVNTTSFHIGDYEALKESSLDPYIAIRNAYIQNRRNKLKE